MNGQRRREINAMGVVLERFQDWIEDVLAAEDASRECVPKDQQYDAEGWRVSKEASDNLESAGESIGEALKYLSEAKGD